jgi:hypothetical protein
MLENIAPVAPEWTLLVLERTIAKATDEEARRYGTHYIQLLGSLAYEDGLFYRCVALLVRLARADDEKKIIRGHGTDLKYCFSYTFQVRSRRSSSASVSSSRCWRLRTQTFAVLLSAF